MTRKEKVVAVVCLVLFVAIIALGGMIDQVFLADGYIH